MFDRIGHCYPERSNRVIILNAGWTFGAIWYVVKSFLSAETISKYIFIDGYYEEIRVIFLKKIILKNQLLEHIDEENLFLYSEKKTLDEKFILEREAKLFGE
jgi:hypothetical protein